MIEGERRETETRVRMSKETQGHGPSTQKTQTDTETERHECMYIKERQMNEQSTRAVTTEQAGEQMQMLDRLRTKRGYNGGAAGSTHAFLEAARASRNLQKRKRWRMNRGEVFGFGPTTLRPPQCTIPFSQRLPLFYSFKREPFSSLISYLPNLTT